MKAISLFSGAGGMDLGVRQAGFDILACLEIDPHCCDTLRHHIIKNDYATHVIEGDITQIAPEALLAQFNLTEGELDLLFGGPPCQPFSQIGKQLALSDERGLLIFEMIRFAQIFRPKMILIEQVKGLLQAKDTRGQKGGVFQAFIKEFEDLDYRVTWQVIKATDFGVPQNRERLFIVCQHNPVISFEFPEPTHRDPNDTNLFNAHLPIYKTVKDVLIGLSEPTTKNQTAVLPEDSHIDVTTDGDRRRIKGVPQGAWLASQTHLPKEQICNLTKKDTTKFRRLSFDSPSLTLRCGEIFFHPIEDRILTPKEYLLLHGYPDDYVLKGPIKSRSGRVKSLDQHRQVANSVPPPVAYVLAVQILKVLECQNYMKSSVIDTMTTR